MSDFLTSYYLILKSLHIIAVVFWMASLFYLPRLFCYHARVPPHSETSELFKTMEKRLVRIIMTPAMIMTWLFGLCLLGVQGVLASPLGWLHAKIFLVLVMSGFHGISVSWMKDFAQDKNKYSEKFFRLVNEVPPFLFILIVFLVVLKSF
jgi:putative membrane protein